MGINRRSSLLLPLSIVAVVLALGFCTCCSCISAILIAKEVDFNPPATGVPPSITLEPFEVGPLPTPRPLPDEAEETAQALAAAEIPESDLHELAIRFLGMPPETPRVAAARSPDYPIGTVRVFHVSNLDENRNFDIEAELVYKTEHVYMWVEKGLRLDQDRIQEAADLFEEHTYPTNREFFGSEWTPGVDGDPHLSILHARDLGHTVAGYFSSADEYVSAARADSNEMEMFYIHVERSTEVGDPFYNGVLAHEFQHMIHWYNDRNETTWLNEGCSELAMELNDRSYPGGRGIYDVGGSEYAYLDEPDTQLNTWPELDVTGAAAPHYGAAYLFMSYFLDRFGEDATKALVAHKENGLKSVDATLKSGIAPGMTHLDLFADWVVANLIDDLSLDNGQYGYQSLDLGGPRIDAEFSKTTDYPQQREGTVSQYGVDYVEIESRQPLTLSFVGSDQVRLLATEAHSGKYMWWSNRADESDSRLTYVLDLSKATQAELAFWAWYHIEADWDYAYVVVGTAANGRIPVDLGDPSISWHILDDATLQCTTANPNNGNLGCGFTGESDGWKYLSADLTPFVGQEIAIRFEYITDAAVNQPGLALDDIQLTVDGEVVLFDDVEAGEGLWRPEGFVRHANVLAQQWIVQAVLFSGDRPLEVQRLLFNNGSIGRWVLPFDATTNRAVIVISAVAPITTEPAQYRYMLSSHP